MKENIQNFKKSEFNFFFKSINSNVYQCLHLLTNYYFFSFLLLIAGCPYPGITTTVKMSVPGQGVEKCQKPTITTTAEMFCLPLPLPHGAHDFA